MKHRGRHRRRKQGRAARAFLAGTALALTAAATMISASQATVGDNPGALEPLTRAAETRALRLQEQLVPQATLDELASGMGKPVGVRAVLETADRSLRTASACTATERTALPVAPTATRAYCWDAADTRAWRAGAVTTSGDADDDGWWNDNRVLLSGWNQGTADRGLARVAFVDANDLGRLRYASALLVVPVDGGRDYRALTSRLSGMVWYQDKLLVTAGDGLYVYDMNRVQRTTVDSAAVGRVEEGWSAHGYRFVLPAVGSYRLTGGSAAPALGGISLDRGTAPDSLVASERTAADSDRPARLWRYDFSKDPARPGLLSTDATGSASAVEAYQTEASGIAGVLSHPSAGTDRSDWYVSRAPGSTDRQGSLWRQDSEGAEATRCGSEDAPRCWGVQAGPLSYWQETGEVWSQSGRALFAVPLASIDRALG
ncbi:hypothetical protein ACM01_19655 [Streptomyces viridochromogenes]|uniref:Secreted protein n=1 Tax=Streptomyces viridochromogenes TaxID=1938 RepID=A0A0J7ZBL9_STRVR|nr:hypothetical protein [Streptomyces viridochromogenes]KMS73224.1 hypothetical protein ACM01_19655 [Streptomyces viridochromogenes]KOG17396.1 hypothetical protein ADK36_24675 [Streptomyces viridochromogenes]KOG18381.1 hypothetical protein ADK35_22095 [Streptomyces viridochromogenes]